MWFKYKKIIILVILALLIGAGIVAAQRYFFKNKPEDIKKEDWISDQAYKLKKSFYDLTTKEQEDIITSEPDTSEEIDISDEAVRAKCLEDLKEATDEELIKQIEVLKYPEKIIPEYGEERSRFAYKQLINYLVCQVRNNKTEENYNKVKDYIQGLRISKASKDSSLAWLEEAYNSEYDSLSSAIAFAGLDELCSQKLTDYCHEKAVQVIGDIEPWLCENMCEKMKKFLNDEQYYEILILHLADISKFKSLSGADLAIGVPAVEEISAIKQWRVALAYRKGGEEEVYRICNNFLEGKQGECRDYVKKIILSLKEYEKGCNGYLNNVKNVVCEY